MDLTEQLLRETKPRPGLSKLEPFRDLIAGLRRKRVGYREIAKILSGRCGLSVSKTAVHSFVRVRAKRPRKQYELPDTFVQETPMVDTTELQARLDRLRQRQAPPPEPKKLFEYESGRPLTLIVAEPPTRAR